MKKTYDIAIVGRGGQGVIFLARVLGEAALAQGIPVRVTESHGMAMRGGSVSTFLRLGESLAPLFPGGTGDLLLAVDSREVGAGLPALSPGAPVLVNSPRAGWQEVGRAWSVDACAIALSEGAPRAANLALLGAATAVPGFPVGMAALEEAVAARGRDRERNLSILRRGAEEARKG